MFSVILHTLQPSWNIYQSSYSNVFYYFSDVAFFFFMLYWESLPSMLLIFSFVLFWLCHKAYGILVPWPEIEPTPPALEAQSLNHWTARKSLLIFLIPDSCTTTFFKKFSYLTHVPPLSSKKFFSPFQEWCVLFLLELVMYQEFPGGPVIRTWCFYCHGPGSVPGWRAEIQ